MIRKLNGISAKRLHTAKKLKTRKLPEISLTKMKSKITEI